MCKVLAGGSARWWCSANCTDYFLDTGLTAQPLKEVSQWRKPTVLKESEPSILSQSDLVWQDRGCHLLNRLIPPGVLPQDCPSHLDVDISARTPAFQSLLGGLKGWKVRNRQSLTIKYIVNNLRQGKKTFNSSSSEESCQHTEGRKEGLGILLDPQVTFPSSNRSAALSPLLAQAGLWESLSADVLGPDQSLTCRKVKMEFPGTLCASPRDTS